MSIQFTTPTTYLQRTTGLVQGSAASYSCVCWFRPDQDAVLTAYQTVFSLEDVTQNQWQGIFSDANLSNGSYQLSANNGSLMQTSDTILTAGQWYPIGYHRSGTSHSWYVSTNFAASFTLDMSAVTFATLFLGDDTFGANHGTFAYFREWTAILSQQEMRDEACSRTAVRTSGLVTDTPLTSDLNDLTSNNNDWTSVGAGFSFIADDPIPDGASAADPIVITLPYSTTVDVKPTDVEFLFNHWLKYTAVAPEVYIGGWFFGQLTVGQYRPSTTVFSDAGVTHYPPHFPLGPSGTQNLRFQMPVTAGDSYWFQAVANWVTMTSHTLTIDFLTAPMEAIPAGSGFVNDDTQDFYAGVISMTPADNYHVLAYEPFTTTASENGGEVMPTNGNILVYDDIGNTTLLYDQDLTELADVGISIGAVNPGKVQFRRTSDGSSCYIGYHLTVKQVSDAGVVGSTTWTLTGTDISSLAPNNAQTILYVDPAGIAVANKPIKQWNLLTSSYDADLVAGVASSIIVDMLVLSDDTILALRQSGAAKTVTRYSDAGALLNIYTIGNGDLGSIEYDFEDPDNYFLARIFDLVFPGSYTIIRVKLSDGSTTQVDHVTYNAGIYAGDVTAAPIAKFGLSASCPFFTISLTSPAPPNEPQIFPIRRERIFRHLSEEQQWIFYQWLQIDAEAGVGLSEGQGSDPQIILQWSDDGGHTWSNEHFLSAGRMGEYTKRPRTQQIGRSRDRVFKVAMSDPVKWALLSAYFGAEKGTS